MTPRPDRLPRLAWLPALLIALALLALPAGAAAAEPTGISGTVSFENGAMGEGVMACALTLEVKVKCATADATGAYEITGLAEGAYVVEFLTTGEVNFAWEYYSTLTPHTRTYIDATPVRVTAEAVTPDVDAVLEEGASIGGTVKAATNDEPVVGVRVCALESPTHSRFEPCVKSSETGEYAIHGLPPGEFDVYFYPEGVGMGLLAEAYKGRGVGEAPEAVQIIGKESVLGIDASLDPGGQISGTVSSAATKGGLGGIEVCLSEAAMLRRLTCLVTPATGGYRFNGLATGSYKVVFSPELADIYGSVPFPTEAQLHPGEWAAFHDAFPTQWFNAQPSFLAATPIALTAPESIVGIDDLVGTAPPPVVTAPPVAPPATAVVQQKPKPLKCKRGFVKRKVHGKPRCVRRHKPRRHRPRGSEAR